MRSARWLCSAVAGVVLSSSAWAGVAVAPAGSVMVFLQRTGEAEPYSAEIDVEVEGALGATVILPDGSTIPLDEEDGPGRYYAETTAPSLADLLEGTGVTGTSTWQVQVAFAFNVTSTYSFDALFEETFTEADLPQRATITSPVNGSSFGSEPTQVDWVEPPDAALADVTIVSVYNDVVWDTIFERSTLAGDLNLDPLSANESLALTPGPSLGEYELDIEYARIADPVDYGVSSLSYVSGPLIEWGLPDFLEGLPYPDNTPFVASIANTESRYVVVDVDGDFNDDGVVDAVDADILYQNIGLSFSPELDLSLNGVVDAADFELWLALYGSAGGDFNYDRRVDLLDLSILASNFGFASFNAFGGDANADGVTDLLDLSILASNFGFVGVVPEPGMLWLLGAGLAGRRFRV
ncbi:PEP-CTERM sorting domain-containing protein [Mucisphaera calidilacus]|uniref:Ice-binding protein C-terminal domain-containing protein n=1 Tax=Mucisphaera calidilacus TaxID=2527982 RepID=A0A518BZ72_9BACT|nr:PEP-CTERM sorting domain-containing protein [Mucisphaera calidilacus]QDU72272.1 hypothetical protein Pan265_21360 [Mucisphaera calidilacus]